MKGTSALEIKFYYLDTSFVRKNEPAIIISLRLDYWQVTVLKTRGRLYWRKLGVRVTERARRGKTEQCNVKLPPHGIMDPISIITLCASATLSAYNVSQTLYSFINSSRSIDAEVEALASEVTGVRRVLDAIGVIFANPLIKSEKATSVENAPIWAAVAGALNDCRISIENFNLQLTGHTRKPAGNSFLRQSLKWMKLSFKLEDICKIRFQMNTHTNNLQISLQMVSMCVLDNH